MLFQNNQTHFEHFKDIVVEFSPASVINKNIEKLLDSNADLIIGSSGVSPEMLSKLKKTTDRKIIVIPNFSIGAAYQKLFAAALSENFKSANITFSSEEPAELKTSIKLFMT